MLRIGGPPRDDDGYALLLVELELGAECEPVPCRFEKVDHYRRDQVADHERPGLGSLWLVTPLCFFTFLGFDPVVQPPDVA